FNARDAVAFCQLPYMHMPEFIPKFVEKGDLDAFFNQEASWNFESPVGEDVPPSVSQSHSKSLAKPTAVPLKDLLKRELYPAMVYDVVNPDLCIDMVRALGESPRFREVRLSNLIEPEDKSDPERFCALTADLGNGVLFISFRGTDSTVRGWKDNYEMGFLCPVHSQKVAAAYFSQLLRSWHGAVILGGHSKGGNLAIYASSVCPKEVQDRILAIYSLDGPGFNPEFLQTEGFKRIEAKIHKIVPEFSFIGSLLESPVHYSIVKSNASGIKQHYPISWQFKKNLQFNTAEKIAPLAAYIGDTFNKWINQYDAAGKKIFIDTLFDSLAAAGYNDFEDIFSDFKSALPKLYRQFRTLPPSLREAMIQFFQDLANIAFFQLPVIKAFTRREVGSKD
ncbi:MAG: DUF2974 domain-containing protein, partial [Aeriscardovia sp.]|nr:DUF2974 domain-containing protein [Aeriscardovia sp.]